MFKILLFSLYFAFALVTVFPKGVLPLQEVGLYAIFVLISYLFLKQSGIVKQGNKEGLVMIILFVLDIGLLVSHLVYLSGPGIVSRIPEPFVLAFVNEWAVVAWFVVPLVVLAFLRDKKK
jgi:hypothetical protein